MAVGKCINHNYRDAVSRCRECHKPLCGECQLVTEEGTFCGEACHEKAKAFRDRVGAMDAQKKPGKRLPKGIGCILKLAILVVIVVLVLHFVFGVDSIDSFLELIAKLKGKLTSRRLT